MSDKKRHNDLVRMEKHPHFYVNPVSKKITYRRTHKGETTTIRTGAIAIGKAKEVVELEMEKRRTGQSEAAVKRRLAGATNPTLEDIWLDELMPVKCLGKSEATRRTYDKSWTVGFGPFWKEKQCSELTPANVSKFKKWYLDEHPNRHCLHTIIHFKMLVDFVVKQKYLAIRPDMSDLDDLHDIVEKNAKRPVVGRVYSDEQVRALLSVHEKLLACAAGEEPTYVQKLRSIRLKLGIRLGLRGLRKMEAMKLERANIDLKNKKIGTWSSKNGKWREVPIDDSLASVIAEHVAIADDSVWLFPMQTDSSRHISAQVFDDVWYEGRALAGIVPTHRLDCRFHDLRHTFATWTSEQGWPPKVACSVLDMTLAVYGRIYSKPRIESKTEWMNKTFGAGSVGT